MTENLQSPLHAQHLALGAKLGPFGGWDMPIEYPVGTVAEHNGVRSAVGLFDVSHMGKLRITGAGAKSALNSILANDLDRIENGSAQYSMLCNAAGGIVDDLIVYLIDDDEVRIIPNASNATEVAGVLQELLPEGLNLENRHHTEGIIAVQGPNSTALLAAIGLDVDLDYMSIVDATWQGHELSVCRTGYTGEQGYEIVAGVEFIGSLWDSLMANGESLGVVPAGLGARDTLRTEMGYPLHGQDISPTISPVEARTGWAVGWKKEQFVGRDALLAQKEAGPKRIAWGLLATGRGIPRGHMSVKNASGAVIGETTSGTFSPTLGQGIALALLDPSVAVGDEVVIDVRGRELAAIVAKPPFVDASPK